MKNLPFDIIDDIVVRAPIYPYKNNLSVDDIYKMLSNDFFLEAIYIASPSLYDECIKFKNDTLKTEKKKNKIISSLYRYYSRMNTRSTPFGLFSTCEVATWGNTETSKSEGLFYRHTRLDMHLLQIIISVLSQIPDINDCLLYKPNNSIYKVGGELRYIEYSFINGFKKYRISAINKNDYIIRLLDDSKNGLSKLNLINSVVDDNISVANATVFIENLLESQFLVSEFEVATTSNADFALQILKHLEELYERSGSGHIYSILELFKEILKDLQVLDSSKTNNVIEYKKIIEKLLRLQPKLDEGKTFHIDSYRESEKKISIRSTAKDEIIQLLEYFLRLNEGNRYYNTNLVDFKVKFIERYDSQFIPLIEALDDDIGIGYPTNRKVASSALVDDIPFSKEEANMQIQLSAGAKWLMDILNNPTNKDLYSIQLDLQKHPLKFEQNKPIDWSFIPRSMSAMFRLLDDEKETMFFENFSGTSAAALLSRFTYGNKEIRGVVEEIISKEAELTENCIFAEIVHLPDNRVTNVIMHPPFLKYEIPYLANASSNEDKTIKIEDLFLKVENNDIVLFSKKMNKRIIPRKTNMHNHFFKSIPLYHFLADLENDEGNRIIKLPLDELIKLFVFIPRLYYKNIIVSPAMWNFTYEIFEEIVKEAEEKAFFLIDQLRNLYKIPQKVLFVEGDNDLLIDFCDLTSVHIFINLIKKNLYIQLKEFLWVGNESGMHIRQYVSSVIWKGKKDYVTPLPEKLNSELLIQRYFLIGSEWLYFKLYCGIGSMDIILKNVIFPIVMELTQSELIKKWFYIKYNDGDYHIRLRLQIINKSEIHKVLTLIYQKINESKEKELIRKLLPDNYEREIERYGANTMEICESIFYIDSLTTISLIFLLKGHQNGIMTFLWGMRMVDDFLNKNELSIHEKMNFVDLIRSGYKNELGINKDSIDKINFKYNKYKDLMIEIMSGDTTHAKYRNIYSLLEHKLALQQDYVQEILNLKKANMLMLNYNSLISSLIHMMLNRLITHKERLHEYLIYEFLFKYYNLIINKINLPK